MTVIDTVSARNAVFAASQWNPALAIIPSQKVMIVGCLDPRVDPLVVLGLAHGDAAVIRNIGGRMTPETIQTLDLLDIIAQKGGGKFGPGWNLIVLHHTDCGILRIADAPGRLAPYLGTTAAELHALHVTDPYASVKVDIEALRAAAQLSSAFTVSGLVYDVATGKVEVVVPPAPLRT